MNNKTTLYVSLSCALSLQVLFLMRYFWYICIKTAHVVHIRHRALVSGVHLAYIYLFGLVISSIILTLYSQYLLIFLQILIFICTRSSDHTIMIYYDKVFVKQVWLVNVMFICGYKCSSLITFWIVLFSISTVLQNSAVRLFYWSLNHKPVTRLYWFNESSMSSPLSFWPLIKTALVALHSDVLTGGCVSVTSELNISISSKQLCLLCFYISFACSTVLYLEYLNQLCVLSRNQTHDPNSGKDRMN